jgi:hypothetical protein
MGSLATLVTWSLFAWVAYGLVEVVSPCRHQLGSAHAGLAGWLTDAVGDMGQILIVPVWLLGGLVILGVQRVSDSGATR